MAPSSRTTRPAAAGNDDDTAPDQGRAGDDTAYSHAGNAGNDINYTDVDTAAGGTGAMHPRNTALVAGCELQCCDHGIYLQTCYSSSANIHYIYR